MSNHRPALTPMLIACLSGPEHTRANVDVALEDARIPHLPEKHHGMMDWNSKLSPFASDEAEKQAKKRKHHGPQGFVTVHVADAAELNAAVSAVEPHGWALRVHYPEPDRPQPGPESYLERLERRIIALEAQSARPPMMGGAVESPPWALQAGSYPAEQTRRAVFMWAARTAANTPGIVQGGLASATDCQVSAPVSGLSVNVSTGEMLIPGTEGGTQGAGYARVTSTTNATISTANPTNPRIDRIVALMSDAGYAEPTGGSGSQWAISVVTGTATSGATLANLSGAAAQPPSSLLLANVLVPATATNIITADIANVATQVRLGLAPTEWAYAQITSPAAIAAISESGATTIITAPSFTADGSPVITEFWCPYVTCDSAAVGDVVQVSLWEGSTEITRLATALTVSTSETTLPPLSGRFRFTPSAGAHTYHIGASAGSLTGSPTIGAGPGGTAAYAPAFVRFTKA